MAKAPINVTISGDYNDRDIKRAIKDLQSLQKDGGKTSQSLGSSFKDIAAKAALVGGAIAGVGAVINTFVQSASNLAESQSKVGVVFAENADEVMAWAKQSAVAFGQTEQQALEAAGTYGNLFQAFGLTRDAATEMSTTMVELAADLASFNNTSIDDAIEALRSGLSGETEPLKRFGIALNDSRMKAEAMALGIYEGTGALNAAQKAQAAYAVIMKDTTLAQGDFARTSDGLANQQRILEAQFGNLVAQLGTALLPAALAVVGALNTMIGSVTNVSKFIGENTRTVALATAGIIALTAAMLANRIGGIAFAAQYAAHTVAMAAYSAGARIATLATTTLTAAMRAIPFALVITGLIALASKLTDGAQEAAKLREEVYKTARANKDFDDSNGEVSRSTLNAAKQGRFYQSTQKDLKSAISGTVSAALNYGDTLPGVSDKTQELADTTNAATKSVYALLESVVNAARIQRDLANTSGSVTSAIRQGLEAGPMLDSLLERIQQGYVRVEEGSKRAASGAKKANDELDKLSTKKQARLDALKELADTARTSMKEMRDSIYNTVSGWLNIGTAAEAYAARQKAVSDTLTALEEGRKQITKEATAEQLADLQKLADEHERAKAAAAAGAQSIVGEFMDQAKKFGEFGKKMRQLLAAGLNRTTFMQIMELGADRGSEVADAYLKGNTSELIAQTNATVAEYDKLSQEIARESADSFYKAGLASAVALLKAFAATLGKGGAGRKELQALIKDLEKDLVINVTTNVATPTGGTQSFTPSGGGGGGTYYGNEILAIVNQPSPELEELRRNLDNLFGPYPFAEGGIVMAPTLGLVGEAGPEAIIPLDRLGDMGGNGSTTNINLTVNAGMGTNGAEVGRQIVDALKAYERRNGAVYASA